MMYHYEKMCAARQPVLHLRSLLLFALTGFILLLAGSAPAQTRWTKFQGNPVLEPGPSGAFDDTDINWYSVLFDEGIYKMWYTGTDTTDILLITASFGYATSTDGTNWTKYSGNPVLSPGLPGSWESFMLDPIVIRMGDTLKMWYGGYNFDIGKGRVGYATSIDGLNWVKFESNPIMDFGSSGEWDDGGVAPKSVIFDGTIYRMWYVGYDASNWHRIGYATSPDGITWTKYDDLTTTAPPFAESDPVLKPGPRGSWDYDDVIGHSVLFDGSIFHMWYEALELSTFTTRVGYAMSPDGIHWKKYDDPTTTDPPFVESDPVLLTGTNGSWDDAHVGQPKVLFDGTIFHLWYNGSSLSLPNIQIGYATAPNDSIQYWFTHDLLSLSAEGSERFPLLVNDIRPALIIQNIGSNTEIGFAVTCQIDSNGTAVYSSTRTVDTLASFEETTVIFEEWDNMRHHSYDATFFTQLSTDGNTSNDSLKTTIEISNLVDDFESDMGKWYSDNRWRAVGIANSGRFSLNNSITGSYENNVDSWIEYNYSFNLSKLEAAFISYWTKYFIQPDFDFGFVEASADGGQTWEQLGAAYSGYQAAWIEEGRSLTKFCGPGFNDVRIRFHFVSDSTVALPGWFIDDINIYPFEMQSSIAKETEKQLPNEFVLFDNYPNPFNPSTSISYELPKNSHVILMIFNLLGQEIRILVNESKEAGHHTVHWDGEDNSGKKAVSGVYLYQIKAGDLKCTKKMLLLQ